MEMYWDIMARKEDSEKRAATNHSMLEHTNLFADDEAKLSLEDCKRQILKNLQILVMSLIPYYVLAAHPFNLHRESCLTQKLNKIGKIKGNFVIPEQILIEIKWPFIEGLHGPNEMCIGK